ncbi:MAG: Csp1 family four helix bundle copper storage protein [Spirochaetaceae bacterium]|nr:Csp1 family four helix bundle copper storage protein [Myxococcales bacterium]MCB9726216.1 Csp1 family four helix bundle copper storage protein [Spirochaetaceae bacterium]HPG26764.1 Csp1 family four helix bundle copper storage protein [Myxococcota bacterium]
MSDVEDTQPRDIPTSRRHLLFAGAGVIGGLAAGALGGSDAKASSAEQVEHHAHAPQHAGRSALARTARECIADGETCLAHCFQRFATGDASLAACAASVEEMLQACETLAKFATMDSRHLAAVVRFCAAVCEDCERECRRHAQEHDSCAACAESCARCIEACRAFLDA